MKINAFTSSASTFLVVLFGLSAIWSPAHLVTAQEGDCSSEAEAVDTCFVESSCDLECVRSAIANTTLADQATAADTCLVTLVSSCSFYTCCPACMEVNTAGFKCMKGLMLSDDICSTLVANDIQCSDLPGFSGNGTTNTNGDDIPTDDNDGGDIPTDDGNDGGHGDGEDGEVDVPTTDDNDGGGDGEEVDVTTDESKDDKSAASTRILLAHSFLVVGMILVMGTAL